MGELTKRDRECLELYAKSNMNANEAARRNFMHRNTVEYHLEQVKKKTGLNPRDFFDLAKLMEVL